MPRKDQQQQWSPVDISKWVAKHRTNPEALYWINKAISSQERGNKSCLAIMKQIRAQIYHSQGNIEQALEDINDALRLGGSPDTQAIINQTKAQIDREVGVSFPSAENVPLPTWCARVQARMVNGNPNHLVWDDTSDSAEELGRGL